MSHRVHYNDLLYTNTFTHVNPPTIPALVSQVQNPGENIDIIRQYPGIRRHNEVDIRETRSSRVVLDKDENHMNWISVNVDSRERDYLRYPNPSEYRYYFKYPIPNVHKIRLVTSEVPFSDFLIKLGNAFVNFTVDDVPNTNLTAQMEEGNYTEETLATELEDALNSAASDAGSSTTFTVTQNSGVLRIQADGGFSLKFKTGCHADIMTGYDNTTQSGTPYAQLIRNPGVSNLGDRTVHVLEYPNQFSLNEDSQYICDNSNTPIIEGSGSARAILGFNWEDYCSVTMGGNEVVVAPNRMDVCGERYLLLKLDQNTRDVSVINSYYNTPDTFAKLPRYPELCGISYFKENEDAKYERLFYPPVNKMEYVDVKYLTGRGDTYNFRGLENSFTLRFQSITGNVNAINNQL